MLIELQDLGKSFGEHEVLKHVTASVERGDRIGIIGANGTGKTTLLRVLCGESLPDAGDAAFAAGATCGYLEQTGHLDPEKDVYERFVKMPSSISSVICDASVESCVEPGRQASPRLIVTSYFASMSSTLS